tara:strand:+ start:1478 stop:1963 length:486 start_codon:yes stop_codon:yes gene_type:complete
MRIKKSEFKSLIRDLLHEVLEDEKVNEINTTSSVEGYETPFAFDPSEDEKIHKNKIKKRAEVFDFKITSDRKNNTLKLTEGKSLFHIFRDASDYNDQQKLGISIREINKLLNEIQKLVNISSRFKIEKNVSNDKMWKTTNRYLHKLDEKIKRISNKIKELR